MNDIITYENLKNILSLSEENEFQDKFFLHYCCNLLDSSLKELDIEINDENKLSIQAIIIRAFKYKSKFLIKDDFFSSNLTDNEMMELYSVIKESVVVTAC